MRDSSPVVVQELQLLDVHSWLEGRADEASVGRRDPTVHDGPGNLWKPQLFAVLVDDNLPVHHVVFQVGGQPRQRGSLLPTKETVGFVDHVGDPATRHAVAKHADGRDQGAKQWLVRLLECFERMDPEARANGESQEDRPQVAVLDERLGEVALANHADARHRVVRRTGGASLEKGHSARGRLSLRKRELAASAAELRGVRTAGLEVGGFVARRRFERGRHRFVRRRFARCFGARTVVSLRERRAGPAFARLRY